MLFRSSETLPVGTNDNLTMGTYQDPIHTYEDTGIYNVMLTVENAFGCVDTAMHNVKIISEYILFAPNAFSPNDDSFNNYFRPKVIGMDESEFELNIYDRWGNLIYEYKGEYTGWRGLDGKANNGNISAQIDVYVWLIRVRDLNDVDHEYIGHVALIK